MTNAKQNSSTEPDWTALANKLSDWQRNHRGWLAEIKRVKDSTEVADLPSYYRFIQGCIKPGRVAERAVFLLPWLHHQPDTVPIGAQFRKNGVSEIRLFQLLRAEHPNDLVILRRLIQQTTPSVDWAYFGKVIQFWGQLQKRQLLQDYFLYSADSKISQDKEENNG